MGSAAVTTPMFVTEHCDECSVIRGRPYQKGKMDVDGGMMIMQPFPWHGL
jgi:hypothetical protein